MAKIFDDVGDLKKLIAESVDFDPKTKSKIYNLAKSVIDHDKRYTKEDLDSVRTMVCKLPFISAKQRKGLQSSSLVERDEEDNYEEEDYYNYCCNGQGD